MATARRRETLIALQARRTASRVAMDLLLFRRTRPLAINCDQCQQPFVPAKKETICPGCAPPARELPAYPWPERQRPPERVLPANWYHRFCPTLARIDGEYWVLAIAVFSVLALLLYSLFLSETS